MSDTSNTPEVEVSQAEVAANETTTTEGTQNSQENTREKGR